MELNLNDKVALITGASRGSGGQSPEEATANLNALNQHAHGAPWLLSISYGRALQRTPLHTWLGKVENVQAAQQTLLECSRLNHMAMLGEYQQ